MIEGILFYMKVLKVSMSNERDRAPGREVRDASKEWKRR